MSEELRSGIQILDTIHFDVYKPVYVADMELVVVPECPCCNEKMDPMVLLNDKVSENSVRIGHCSGCGYIGYIDKPTEAWIHTFYNETWDKSTEKTLTEIKPFSPSIVVEIAKELGIDHQDTVFDIGTGYGQLLKQFKDAGFTNLHGSEHSPHRAAIASEYANANVKHMPFVAANVSSFSRDESYKLIYSKSVMEHVYEPNDLFKAAKELQSDGDYLVILVPNTDEETVPNITLFVPHLHSFSRQSLVSLAYRHGYEPLEVRKDGCGIILIAKRSVADTEVAGEKLSYPYKGVQRDLKKWRVGFAYDDLAEHPKVYWNNIKDFEVQGVIHDLQIVPYQ